MSAAEQAKGDKPNRDAAVDAVMREIGQLLGLRGDGFALFLEVDGAIRYVSNAERGDVLKTLDEWQRRALEGAGPALPAETRDAAEHRRALERRCAGYAEALAERSRRVGLFLFDFGEGGALAFSLIGDVHRAIVAWVHAARGGT